MWIFWPTGSGQVLKTTALGPSVQCLEGYIHFIVQVPSFQYLYHMPCIYYFPLYHQYRTDEYVRWWSALWVRSLVYWSRPYWIVKYSRFSIYRENLQNSFVIFYTVPSTIVDIPSLATFLAWSSMQCKLLRCPSLRLY